MKIEGRKNQQVGNIMGPVTVHVPSDAAPVEESSAPAAGDKVELTSASIGNLKEMAQAMPSVRADKVEVLRDAIEDGSYYVESEKLARKVVDEVLAEAVLKERNAH